MKHKLITVIKISLLTFHALFNIEIHAAPSITSEASSSLSSSPNITINQLPAKKVNNSGSFINIIKNFFRFKQPNISTKKDTHINQELSEQAMQDKDHIDDESFVDTKKIAIGKIEPADSVNLEELPIELRSKKVAVDNKDETKSHSFPSKNDVIDKKTDNSTNTHLTEEKPNEQANNMPKVGTQASDDLTNTAYTNISQQTANNKQNISADSSNELINNPLPIAVDINNTKNNSNQQNLVQNKPLAEQSNTLNIVVSQVKPKYDKKNTTTVNEVKDKTQSTAVDEIDNLLQTMHNSQVKDTKNTHQNTQLPTKKIQINQYKSTSVDSARARISNKTNLLNKKLGNLEKSNSKTSQKISEPVLSTFDSNQLSDQQNKFIIDEAKVLLLPDDDVILGQITEEAKINSMNWSSYVKLLKSEQDKFNRQYQKEITDHFVEYVNQEPITAISLSEATTEAFMALKQDSLSKLKILLDNYPLLQATDDAGDTLIEQAVYMNNYLLTKLLIMKGANLAPLDYQECYDYRISQLLKNAGVK
ncbi:MAG: hypothetical protein EOP33_04940 [Rickettsiaceae bacterium]|nr:MAG: hypothetical protein EOP33_04940 [Rickettsiaceae bacterium]